MTLIFIESNFIKNRIVIVSWYSGTRFIIASTNLLHIRIFSQIFSFIANF
jgi:hypothetical protein